MHLIIARFKLRDKIIPLHWRITTSLLADLYKGQRFPFRHGSIDLELIHAKLSLQPSLLSSI